MRRKSWLGGAFLVASIVILLWSLSPKLDRDLGEDAEVGRTPTPVAPPPNGDPDPEPLIGEALLERYADPEGSVEEDLQYVQRVLMSLRTLVKTIDPGRMAVNEDIVDVLLGKNPYKIVFLPKHHKALNESGQLVDRWGTPLFFHLEAADRLDIRSAGPDERLFTQDDCQLAASGAFIPVP